MGRDDQIVLDISLAAIFYNSRALGRFRFLLGEALDRQRSGRSFWLVVPDLQTLDFCVTRGIKPSNIKLPSEYLDESLRPDDWWQQAHVGIFEDTQ